jgi:hypothetical protein
MKKIYLLFVFITSLLVMNNLKAQCTNSAWGAYGTPAPICGSGVYGAWAATTNAYSQEYSTVNVTAGNTYQFQSYVTTGGAARFTTITTTANAALAWGLTSTTASVTWVATFTGQVRFWTHLSTACGASTVNQTRRVRCNAPAGGYNPCTTIPTISGCGTSATANMSGTGAGWSVTTCGYATPGQERLFQFTAPTTGTYQLNVSAITGGYVDFFWKPASGGCNATGWNCIDDISFAGAYNAITPMTFTAGTTYYILLDPEVTTATSATFNMVCPVAVAPVNDACANATNLPCGTASLAGTTAGAVSETAPSGCASNFGVWYTFTGDGQQTTITSTTTFDHELTIVSGACGTLTNVACVDLSTGTETYTFNTVNGTVYRVYVAHYAPGNTTTGTFTMSRTCTPLAYDPCASIPTISGCGTSATANMTGAGAGWSPGSCGYTTPGQERLFSFTAPTTGTYTLNVSAITGGFVDFFWKPASGGCNATGWNCIDDIVGAGTYNAITPMTFTAGTTYYILLDPEVTTATSATFNMVCPVAGPANDLVCSAASITCGGTVSGTTIGAGNAGTGENQTCGTAQTMGGVWYVVPGNGQIMTASLCGTVWDSKISVFSGPNCSTLTCVGGNDDIGPACATSSASYSWTSVVGQNYYILVHGYNSNSAFSINLSCVTPTPPPANDNCANAQSVSIQCPIGATAISGTTANATEEAIADPSCDAGTIRDVWYTFNSGNNTSVNLSVTLGTASWLGGEIHTTCGNPAPGLTIGGNAGNCDFYLLNPAPTSITGLTPNTTYRLRLFSNVDWDIAGSFTFTLTNSQNNPGAVSVPASICAGTATSISNVTAATGAPGSVNYYFYYRGGPSNVTWQMYDGPTTNTSSALPAAVINTPGTWFIARNSDFGCGQANNATTLDLQIIVNQASTAPALAGTSPVCPATSVVINATGGTASPGSTINWYTGPNGTGSFLGTGSSYTVTPSATSTYYARREGGCNTTSDGTYTITVNGPTGIAPSNGDMVWRGASTTDWATLGNWWQYNGTSYGSASAAPTDAQNVIIPANQTCVLNQPNTFANGGNAKSLLIESGAVLTMGNGTLSIAENMVNNGTFTPGSGTIAFIGSGNHSISGSSLAHNFNNVTMNKAGEVQLSVPIAITGTLNLTNGRLDIGNSNLDLPTNTINGGNASSYVKTSGTGTLNRNVAGIPVNFPVGRSAYNPATLTNSGTADKFSVRVIDNVTDDGTAVGTTTSLAVVNRTWMISEQNAGGSDVTLGLNWNGAPEHIGGFQEASAFIAHYISSDGLWDNIGGAVATNTIETSGITSFSPFTISSDLNFAPLPVELMSFSSVCLDNDVAIKWTTASENNSMHFVVETSTDAANWEVLSVVPAAQFSTSILNYAITHEGAARNKNYYRLIQVDLDGAVEFYNVIYANCGNVASEPVAFPNPSNGDFTIDFGGSEMKGDIQLSIMNTEGKEISNREINLEEGVNTYQINNMELQPGIYYLKIVDTTGRSFIIKHSFI